MTQETERPKPLKVEEISSTTLSQFLKSQETTLEIPDPGISPYFPHYICVFDALRTLPLAHQEELLAGFFTQRVENFPNGEKLGKFLTKINNIALFQPQREPNAEILQRLSNQYFQRIKTKTLPLRIIREDWEKAREAARIALHFYGKKLTPYQEEFTAGTKMRIAAEKTSRFEAFRITWLIVHEMATWDYTHIDWYLDARTAATWAATWIIVEDLMPQYGYDKGNPWEVLFEGIYDKGYWFVGPVKGESVIFVPEIKKPA